MPSTTIIAHANAKARMEKMEIFRGANAKFRRTSWSPTVVTARWQRSHRACCFGRGRDGDSSWSFGRLAHLGDLFPAKAAPLIDADAAAATWRFRTR
jgi:hypothetical protein